MSDDITIDDLVTKARDYARRFNIHCCQTFPVQAAYSIFLEQFSKIDGINYPGGQLQIMGPPPIPGMMNGMPTMVPLVLDEDGTIGGLVFNFQDDKGYAFSLERRMEDKYFRAAFGEDFGTGRFTVQIMSGNRIDDEHIAVNWDIMYDSAIPDDVAAKRDAYFRGLEDRGGFGCELSPAVGLHLLNYFANTLLGDSTITEIEDKSKADMVDTTVKKTKDRHPKYDVDGPLRSIAELYAGEYFRNAGVTVYNPKEREALVTRLTQYALMQHPGEDGADIFSMAENFVSSNLVSPPSGAARGSQN